MHRPGFPASPDVLTLEQALAQHADAHQPQIQQADPNAAAAGARQDETLGPLLPQVTGSAAVIGTQYFGGGNNSVIGVSTGPRVAPPMRRAVVCAPPSTLTAAQLLWDFGLTLDRYRSYQAAAKQYHFTAAETRLQAHLMVRTAYYNARALKGLLAAWRARRWHQRKEAPRSD